MRALRNIFPLFAILALSVQVQAQDVESEAPDPVWVIKASVFSCKPARITQGDILTLRMTANHPPELGIRRESDNTWYYLISQYPFDGQTNLMGSQAFSMANEIKIPTDTIAYNASVNPARNERVFTTPGKYDVYVSTALESEDGGYKCIVTYNGKRK